MKKRGRRKVNYKRRRAVVLVAALVGILAIGGITYSVLKGDSETAKADTKKEETSTDKNETSTEKTEEKKLDNSGYIPLKDDPNADDAIEVANMTQGLMKGQLHYPVRKDGKKVVYLTFDDGPSTTNTPKILDILKENDVKATFFVMGKSLESNGAPELLKREAVEGHAIAGHSYTHNYSYLYPNRVINADRFMGEVNKVNEKMQSILGKDFTTRTVRFPGGYWSWQNRTPVREKLDKDGFAIVDWNALNGDAEAKSRSEAQLIAQTKKTVELLGPNADNIVFLMHDTYGKDTTVEALPEIIEYFKSQGFEFRTMK
ncbi:polysaccharide deacetylase [Clostridium sp. LY3-2]|uniref:polysaccharide deacetylase family protein n=1 Tax=Clostridium sp. LY3-2 TaxID=2942482 RepID=UPI002152C161|nr:polysaccharide deacetylase family protein [Clostridium sp. LY3-2]MCR6516091.1 polysaccharide deacetylase [Clostridium sp. LY3-2]